MSYLVVTADGGVCRGLCCSYGTIADVAVGCTVGTEGADCHIGSVLVQHPILHAFAWQKHLMTVLPVNCTGNAEWLSADV